MEALMQFEKKQYLNLETFRKNGRESRLPFGLFRMEKRFASGLMPGPAKPSEFATTALCALSHPRHLASHTGSGSARMWLWMIPPKPFNTLKV
jgi:hypothetical protein